MKKQLAAAMLLMTTACGKGDPKIPDGTTDVTTLSGSITADQRLTADKVWTLEGDVFVEGATVSIEAGTRIVSEGGALIVTRTGRLDAQGTVDKPIVFTSSREVGARAAGDWKGIVLLGSAPINVAGSSQTIEGFAAGTDARADYGGSDATHDCGTVLYTRIEFTGFKLANGNELQGLTLGGCGSKTRIDYVQSHLSTDDGIEIFGGTVDLKHIVVTGADDDGLDWDFGWSGRAQFAVLQQRPNRGNWGIEADNNEKNFDARPRSAPELWNFTIVGRPTGGAEKSGGLLLRRGTAGKLNNFLVINAADAAIDIADAATAAQFDSGALAIRNSIFHNLKGKLDGLPAMPNPKKDSTGATIDPADQAGFAENVRLMDPAFGNRVADPLLPLANDVVLPSFQPGVGSPARNAENAAVPPAGLDVSARFVGAIGAEDWTAGWTASPAN